MRQVKKHDPLKAALERHYAAAYEAGQRDAVETMAKVIREMSKELGIR